VAAALSENSVSKISSVACFWAGILCALASAYFFLIAPIEDVVLAIVLFGCAIGFEVVAALLKRKPGE
jgi:energy-converting hydrogenase Eha subunit C